MLDVDKDAIKELMEMEAVPVCDRLGSLLGRSVKMAVSKVEETDTGALAECLPHFNVVIEGRRADMIRVANYIMGVPVDNPSPLDEIALSTLKEVASQCISAAMNELNDLLGRDMGVAMSRIAAFDNTERILEMIRIWKTDQSLLLVRLHYLIDGVVESDAYIIASQAISQVLGIPELEELELEELAESIQKPKEAVAVQEVSFPEFKYTPLEYDKEQIGDDRKKLLDITLDVSVRIGSTVCSVKDVLALKEGQVLVLDKQAGSPADVVVNGELIGKGDVLVTGEHFGTRIIEIVGKRE